MAMEPHLEQNSGPTNPTAQPMHSPVLFPPALNEGSSEVFSSGVAKSKNNSVVSRNKFHTHANHSAPEDTQLITDTGYISGGQKDEGRTSGETNHRSFQVDYRARFEHFGGNRVDVGRLDHGEVKQSSLGERGEKQSSALRSESRSSQIKITDSILGPKVRTRTFKKLNIKSASAMAGDSLDWEKFRTTQHQESDQLESLGKGSISTQGDGSVNRT